MMNCPICGTYTKAIGRKETPYYSVYRTRECPECLTRFKTQEKLMFESLPAYIKQRFLESGEK